MKNETKNVGIDSEDVLKAVALCRPSLLRGHVFF